MKGSISFSAMALLAFVSCNVGDSSYSVEKNGFQSSSKTNNQDGDSYYYVGVD